MKRTKQGPAHGAAATIQVELRKQASNALDELEAAHKGGQITVRFALTRAFMLGNAFAKDVEAAQ